MRHEAHFQIELVYVRVGTILSLGPVVQYAEAQKDAPLEISVCRGADGHFTVYDDSGNGWGYEKGQRATIDFNWNEAAQTHTIGARQGTFPGMNVEREFRIVWDGAGANEAKAFRSVVYKGKKLAIKV